MADKRRTIILEVRSCSECPLVDIDTEYDTLTGCRVDSSITKLYKNNVDEKVHPNCPLKHTMYKITTK